jgi:outer membrane protein assembly factor BamB
MNFLSIRGFLLLVLCASFSLSGCSLFSKKTGNEPMELEKFKRTADIDKEWSKGIGKGQSKGFSLLTPAIDGDRIYAIDYKGKLVALDLVSGKKIWSKRVASPKLGFWGSIKSFLEEVDPNWQVSAGVGAGEGLILFATYAGEVVALDRDGNELWRKAVSGEVVAPPRTNGDLIVAQTLNGKLFALDAKSGEVRWFYDNPAPVLTLRATSAPLVTDTMVYAGFSNGRLMAFSTSDGVIQWDQRIAMPKGRSELDRMVDIAGEPILHGGILYVGTYQGRISALARGTGSNIWAKDGSTSENMAIQDDKLFVSHSDGKVVCYSASTGEVLWSNEKLLRRTLNSPQVVGQYVAVVDYKGYLHFLNQSDGEFAARTRVGRKGARAPLLTDGERLYVFNNKGKLMAYSIEAD